MAFLRYHQAGLTIMAALAALAVRAEVTTGWIQTAAGTYDYNDTANWYGGEINGVFSSDLALAGAQTITFGHDTELPNGLQFASTGAYKITMSSDGTGTYTLKLGGDFTNASAGAIEPDATLNFDLGGETRTITPSTEQILIHGIISNGGIIYTGAKNLRLYGDNTFADGFDVAGTGYIYPRSTGALGVGTVTFEEGSKVYGESALTLGNANPIVIKGSIYYSGDKSLSMGTGPVTIETPTTITVNKNTFTLGGDIAAGSPYSIVAITKDGGGALTTKASLVLDGDTTLTCLSGTWYFNGAISGTGDLILKGGAFELGSANTFVGNVDVKSGSVRPCANNAIPSTSKVLVESGATFRNYSSKGYGIATMINGGMLDTASAGYFGLAENESTDVDLSNYPDLIFAPNGGDRVYSGAFTIPATGVLKLGGGGKTLKLESVLPAGCDIKATGSLQFNVSQPNFDGEVAINNGYNLTIGSSAELPKATLVMNGCTLSNNSVTGGTLTFAAAAEGSYVRAKDVVLNSSKLVVNAPSAGATTHTISGTLSVGFSPKGGISQVSVANTTAYNSILEIGTLQQATGVEVLNCSISASSTGVAQLLVDNPVLVGSGELGTVTAPIFPWVRVAGALATYEADVGVRALATEEYSVYDAAYSGTVQAEGENLYVKGGVTVDITASANVNSITLVSDGSSHPTLSATDAVLTVASGAVVVNSSTTKTSGPSLNADLDFGDVRGLITGLESKYYFINGSMAGTAGVTLSDMGVLTSTVGAVWQSPANTFTGDAYVTCYFAPKTSTLLPTGEDVGDGTLRTGNAYIYGKAEDRGANAKINAMNGAGSWLSIGSGTTTLRFGYDGSDGDFAGSVGGEASGANFGFEKYGSGRQRFSGTVGGKWSGYVYGGELQIDGTCVIGGRQGNGYHLVIDTGVLSGSGSISAASTCGTIQIKASGVLAPGSAEKPNVAMTLGKNVEMAAGASMRYYVGDDRASQAIVAVGYGITGAAETIPVTVNCTASKNGKWLLLEADTFNDKSFTLDIANGSPGRLTVATDATTGRAQLWYEHMSGCFILIR